MATRYCTITQLEDYLLSDADASFESSVEGQINMAEKFVDTYTGRVWVADTSASARLYDGNGGMELQIDEAVEITKVEVDEDEEGTGAYEEITSGYYISYPANSTPKTRIRLRDSAQHFFYTGCQNVRITGKWGNSITCPEDITWATIILAAGIVLAGSARDIGNNVQSESIGNYNVSYRDERGWQDYQRAMDILNKRKKINI